MEKQQVINKFKEGCDNILNFKRRLMAVNAQYNRAVWEIHGKGGLIRIACYDAPNYSMIIFHTVDSVKANNLKLGEQHFDLTWQEYDELRDAYFGDFKPDVPYLQRIGALG